MAKVLITDDEPSMLRVLQVNLEIEGYETFLAGDGETALKRIEAESPDLVLLDIMMPVMDGWTVLKNLARMPLKSRPRVIIMTAKSGERDMAHGIELGADDYVVKPFEVDDLLEAVADVLSRTDEEAEARRRAFIEKFK